jgi:carboxylate-amine ligase
MSELQSPLALFKAYGIEIEYMVVDKQRLSVLPITDQILKKVAGDYVNEVEQGAIAWSNELVLHVIELKTNGPAPTLSGLPVKFLNNVAIINSIIEEFDGQLMPTAMHPWMNPDKEGRLWTHDSSEIYDAYDKIFDCRGHGWSNLQSCHLNLPFADEQEFILLHDAIRLLMPIMPALTASSPIMNGRLTGLMDTRLEVYRHNADRIPIITGLVVPEKISSNDEYQSRILQPMYAAIEPYDPAGILRHEWLNSRGAITRFDRNAIEIRILDTQETPLADLAIAAMISNVLKDLIDDHWSNCWRHARIATESLARILLDTIKSAELAVIEDEDYLELFEFPDDTCEARELWLHLAESGKLDIIGRTSEYKQTIDFILTQGSLARRIARAVRSDERTARLDETYRALCSCLGNGGLFDGID